MTIDNINVSVEDGRVADAIYAAWFSKLIGKDSVYTVRDDDSVREFNKERVLQKIMEVLSYDHSFRAHTTQQHIEVGSDGVEDEEGLASVSPYTRRYYITDTTFIYMKGDDEHVNDIIVSTASEEDTNKLFAELRELMPLKKYDPPPHQNYIYMLTETMGNVNFNQLPRAINSPLEADNYTEDTINKFKSIVSDMTTENPRGRIALLDGPPDTGKTHLVQSLITEIGDKANCVFVAPGDIGALTAKDSLPALINFSLSTCRLVIFICEDADEIIAPRTKGNMSLISQVLNLGDGILGKLLDIRLILTTNSTRKEFDPAITRNGRLSEMVDVGNLTKAHAKRVYERIGGTDKNKITKSMSLADVYALAKGKC